MTTNHDNGLQLIIEATKALAEKIAKNPRGFKDQNTSLVQANADAMALVEALDEQQEWNDTLVGHANFTCTDATDVIEALRRENERFYQRIKELEALLALTNQ